MKFIIALVLTALLSFAFCLYLPWWSVAVAAFVTALFIRQKPWLAFLSAFLALFLFWGGLTYWLSSRNEHILAHKISLLILKADNPYLLILATALIGALIAGFAALSGSLLRRSGA